MCGRRLIDKSFLTLMQYVTSLTPIWRIASAMFWPCETRTSTCRNFATISSGLYRFLVITVLLDVKDIPQVGPLQWGRIKEVDLREVYRHIWSDGAPAHLIDIAIFCDSDETHGHTVSYFADVRLRRSPGGWD